MCRKLFTLFQATSSEQQWLTAKNQPQAGHRKGKGKKGKELTRRWSKRVSMGLTVSRKTAKNLAVRRKKERILTVSRKKMLTVKNI